jgi:carbon storage regulator CsrA
MEATVLVLSRKPGEVIYLDPDGLNIRIMVTEVKGERVRIGIDAPEHIRIVRDDAGERSRKTIAPA